MEADLHLRIVESVDLAVIVLDRDGRIVLFNPAAQNITGISDRQATGRHYRHLFPHSKGLDQLIGEVMQQGRSISSPERMLLRPLSGRELQVSVAASPLFRQDGSQEGVVVLLRDLQRLQGLEETEKTSDRMAAIGTLAAGLAHEIKNPLGGIKGAAQLLAKELADREELAEYTGIMLREVDRVNGIIEELMNLTRPRKMRWGATDLTRLLNDITLLQRQAHHGDAIDFQLLLDPSIPPILGDEALLHRLFLNLVKNAAEALEGSGRVTVTSRISPDMRLNRPGHRPVPFVEVAVSDNGPGIAEEHLAKIFTPFFSTKEKGSGLGLAICQRIVAEHQGMLKVTSRVGEGTRFQVMLPFIRPDETAEARRD
ncbi:nitrogen specific signal transduction histidine kinase NtrB [Geothermobacter ehrlichii]|uniref:histidine kinase n=1 Tax=Geothermobacter ehrlichii TaxID=213224 RepID=A0A5D3WJB5_9BACT|nr:ATP-binding protein [Geothermobacter ehrlichii]TYO98657.1 nitrogen specific signal transduction histidine kinase NtrB [Geothermobacter ehrlichii]